MQALICHYVLTGSAAVLLMFCPDSCPASWQADKVTIVKL